MPFTDVVQGIPFLQKADLIKHIDEIVTYKSKLASAKTTGGSTGEPVKLYKNPDALARERAATWRSYGWAGITNGDRQARFWGVPPGPRDSDEARASECVGN